MSSRRFLISLAVIITFILGFSGRLSAAPFYQTELIFPLEKWHNHASCILELPSGDLLVTWYHGSGEHTADDVRIEGARKVVGSQSWTQRFTMADSPNFPDGNPIMFLDRKQQLWLVWSMIVANDWRTSFLKFRVSADYRRRDATPVWKIGDTLVFAPRDFSRDVYRGLAEYIKTIPVAAHSNRIVSLTTLAGDKFISRMGWVARSHPIILPTGRILLPLYSAGLSLSMMAISDDGGQSWTTGKPIVGIGNIQPTLVRKNDGTLVAYMRNAGPPPRRLYMSISTDDGVTWSSPRHTNLPNPGSGAEVIRLSNRYWALVYNDTEEGRHSLAVSLSDDEGKSWRWTRHLERDNRREGAGQFHYPSIIQAQGGLIHVSYSYFLEHLPEGAPRKAIKHATFSLDWVKAGDTQISKKP
jgi:predicted neuraminidase